MVFAFVLVGVGGYLMVKGILGIITGVKNLISKHH